MRQRAPGLRGPEFGGPVIGGPVIGGPVIGGPVIRGLGLRGGLPEFVERQVRLVFVQISGHVRDPARVTAHGRREGHAARYPSRRTKQSGSSPARPDVPVHGRLIA
jgi:hypothetical protein